MKVDTSKTILVTGASGHLGRRIVELLLDAGVERVIAGTRTPESVPDLLARGAEIRRVDFDDPSGLKAAFSGADRILMVSTDAVGEPGRRLRQHRIAIAAAADAEVEYLAYTSFARSEADSPVALCADHHGTEQELRASGLPHAALRNSLYAESLMRKLPALAAAGMLEAFEGGGGVAYVAREDCARTAAAAVAGEQPPLGVIEVTGPEIIDAARLAQLAGEITG
jgi:NAD(P)H dehydrogenase (quinone)